MYNTSKIYWFVLFLLKKVTHNATHTPEIKKNVLSNVRSARMEDNLNGN